MTMRYETSDGVEFFVVPDCAKCMWRGTRLDDMLVCPIKKDRPDYDICRPDLCDYYAEDWEADMRGKEHTMEEYMMGQDLGNPDDGSL